MRGVARLLVVLCSAAAAASESGADLYLYLHPNSEWELVLNITRDQCTPYDTTDSMPIAWQNPVTGVTYFVASSSRGVFASTGTSLDDLHHNCSHVVFNSTFDPTPQSFANYQWLQAVHVDPATNRTVALVHNEFHGFQNATYCSINGTASVCNMWSTGLGVSHDGGATFQLAKPPPNHLVAALPYVYHNDERMFGIGANGPLMQGDDGALYSLINVFGKGAQHSGLCPVRSGHDPSDPSSYTIFNGTGFGAAAFDDPYHPAAGDHVCAVLANTSGSHPCMRRLVLPPAVTASGGPAFVLLNDGADRDLSLRYSWSYSPDAAAAITSWTASRSLATGLERYVSVAGRVLYPALLDSSAPSRLGSPSYTSVSNDSSWLYVNIERNVWRRRAVFSTQPPPPPPTPLPPNPAACSTLNVAGAADPNANGVYKQVAGATSDGLPTYASTTSTYHVYRFHGQWRIAVPQVVVVYGNPSVNATAVPVQGWRVGEGGLPPAPEAVRCVQ